jgi:catechol 2,3-dioxygenase-like lactoylglutathione lyase family enzyme
MTIVRITPLLNVADVERSRQFYAETMGFQVSDLAGPQDDPVWARLTRGEAALMLNRRGEGRDRRLFERADHRDVVLYIWVEDAADIHGRLVRLGVDVGDLEQQDYGLLQFALYDPDGYELAITGPPSPA